MAAAATSEVDRNFRAFQAQLPDLVATQAGKLALMHDGAIVDFFDTYADAVKVGLHRFADFGNFSIQEVTRDVRSLGFHSYAGDVR